MTTLIKIAFVGTHGVGKTTLLEALKDSEEIKNMGLASIHFVEETAVKVFELGKTNPALVINQGATLEAQLHIMGMQLQDERAQMRGIPLISKECGATSLMVCDRTVLDAVVYTYSRVFSEPKPYPWATDLPDHLYNWVCKSVSHPYDIVFYLPIEFPLQTTDFRPGDIEFQEKIDDLMQGLFIQGRLGRTKINNLKDICEKVVVLSGSVETRLAKVLKHIKAIKSDIYQGRHY